MTPLIQLDMGFRNYSGPTYLEARRAALSRANSKCQSCGTVGSSLHVHHIKPVSEFDSRQDAHYPGNLVALCASCHSWWEGTDATPVHLDGVRGAGLDDIILELTVDTLMKQTKRADLDELYVEQIQRDPEICTYCHRRIRSYTPPPEQLWRTSIQHIATGRTTPSHHGEIHYPPPKNDSANSKPTVVCEECGVIDSPGHSRDMRTLMDHAHKLRDRLLEKGFPVDDDEFYETVRDLKSDQDWSSKDFEILGEATAVSIKVALESRTDPLDKSSNAKPA